MTFLGAFLGTGAQVRGRLAVLGRCAAPGCGALHRPNQQVISGAQKEQLRTGARDHEPAQVQVGVVGTALPGSQIDVKVVRVAAELAVQAGRVAALEGVAVADALADPVDAAAMLGRCPAPTPVRGVSGGAGATRVAGRLAAGRRPARTPAGRSERTRPAGGRRPRVGAPPGRGPGPGRPRRPGSRRRTSRRRWPLRPRPARRVPGRAGWLRARRRTAESAARCPPVGHRTVPTVRRPSGRRRAGVRRRWAWPTGTDRCRSPEDDRAVTVEQDPALAVPPDGPGQRECFRIPADCGQGTLVVGVIDADHLLFDDRAFVQFRGHVMGSHRGCPTATETPGR
jgi:hypothetical protein